MSRAPQVLGIRIDPVDESAFGHWLERFIRSGESHVVHFCPADPLVAARRDPGYQAVLNRGSLNLPDGMSVVWALRLGGRRVVRFTGTAALEVACRWSAGRDVRHYFLGGTPGVLRRLLEELLLTHPGLNVAGAESPAYGPVEELDADGAAGRILAAGADLVWVGLGAPKQELFAERLRELGCAPVILCVGAAFDFASGNKRRAPLWMQRAGVEWLHRLMTEPGRLWRRYLVGNARFVAGVLGDHLAGSGR